MIIQPTSLAALAWAGAASGSAAESWRIGTVAQEAPGGQLTLLETVLEAEPERMSLMATAEIEIDPHRLGDIHARLEAIDALKARLGHDFAD